MKHLIFLLEEQSMKEVLDILIPPILPDNMTFQTIPHRGKQDLEKSIPRKIKGWGKLPNIEIHFIIARDQDGADCKKIKKRLLSLCTEGGRPDSLVRIVCNELESWFLGDLLAAEKAFNRNNLSGLKNRQKYRNPDLITNVPKNSRN